MVSNINKVTARMTDEHYLPDRGWDKILIKLDEKLARIDPDYKIYQIKEKFGTLRFYFDTSVYDPELKKRMDKYVQIAEILSSITCEMCGDKANLRRELMWKKTLCDGCYPRKSGYNVRKHRDKDD